MKLFIRYSLAATTDADIPFAFLYTQQQYRALHYNILRLIVPLCPTLMPLVLFFPPATLSCECNPRWDSAE